MEERESTDLEVKGFSSLIDDTLAFNSSFSTITPLNVNQSSETQNEARNFLLLGAEDSNKEVDISHNNAQSEELPQPQETLEPERTRKFGKCNLRQSLAWDSAFFTSAGFLDADELSGMIEVADKGKKPVLPGIDEDLSRSVDSISSLESENVTLESLEAELFEDIRASIQKSHKATNVTNSSSNGTSAKTTTQALNSSTKVDIASQNKLKIKPASKKQYIGTQGSGKMMKQGPGHPQVTQTKSVVGIKPSTSSLPKPPKITSRVNPPISNATTRRTSLNANHVKVENDNAKNTTVASKGTPALKAVLGGSRRVVPKPQLSSKSSISSSSIATRTPHTKSSSSFESSGTASSDNIGESPMTSSRRKINTRTINPPSSGSILKTPSNTALKNRATPGNSSLSVYLRSSKLSSSISPASSISEWSLESCSSSSTVNLRSNKSTASVNTSSSRRSLASDAPLNPKTNSDDEISDVQENQVIGLPSQDTKKASVQKETLSRPASMKPSGLRMPSPKIGYFDGVKSMVRTPNGSMRSLSGTSNGLPKLGNGICSPNGSINKANTGKLPPARTVTTIRKVKPDMQKPVSPVHEPLNASTKVSKIDVKSCPSLFRDVQNEIVQEHSVEVGTEKTDAQNEMSLDIMDIKIVPIAGEACDSGCIEKLIPSQTAGDDESLHHLKNNLLLLSKTTEKENDYFEGQVDSLSSYMGVLNLKMEAQKELYVCGRKEESQTELLDPTSLSTSPSISKITASRTPFSVKNSICDSQETDFSKGLSLQAGENTAAMPSS